MEFLPIWDSAYCSGWEDAYPEGLAAGAKKAKKNPKKKSS